MASNLDDPRVRKTRRGLQAALVRLILERGYDNISIQDIATEAETARITFYRHYRDKEELLTDCLNTLYDTLARKTQPLSPEMLMSGGSPLDVLYAHIEEEEALYRILFSSRGTHTVLERMRHHLAQHMLATMTQAGRSPVGQIPPELVAYHIAGAQIGLAMWWLDHDKPYPGRYMARVSVWMTLMGVFGTFGVPPLNLPAPSLEP